MLSKRRLAFNTVLILLPWLSLLFLGKRTIKHFFLAGLVTVIFEVFNAKIGQKRKWWFFMIKETHLFQMNCLLV